MTYYIKRGPRFDVTDESAIDFHKKLPAHNYIIKQDYNTFEHYLQEVDNFSIPFKIYGNTEKYTKRIINTFENRLASTGVMLTGEKGSGKSLLAKSLAIACHEKGIPCIIVNDPFKTTNELSELIQNVDQPAMVLFDEFEKTFNEKQQESVLTLLDGVFTTKKLFVITCNDKYRVDEHMRNRPGRIYYMIDFVGMSESEIRAYVNDNLQDASKTEDIVRLSSVFYRFNFDMLKTIVEEINRYGESVEEVLEILNTKPEYASKQDYMIELYYEDIKILNNHFYPQTWNGQVYLESVRVTHYMKNDEKLKLAPGIEIEDDDAEQREIAIRLTPHDIKSYDKEKGSFEYVKGKYRIVLNAQSKKQFNVFQLI